MTYFELLEQNTNDPEIQFALYEACLAGEDGGTDDADAWLKVAAENGHEKALAIVNRQSDDDVESDDVETSAAQENTDEIETSAIQENTDEQQIVVSGDTAAPDSDESDPENIYEQMSLQELYAKYQTEYGAAKQLLERVGATLPAAEKLAVLQRICTFEACTAEDYEQLFEYYYQTGEIGRCKKLCEIAAERGSALAMKRLAELELYDAENYKNTECAGEKLFAYAQNGTFTDKVNALIVYQYSGIRFKEGYIRKMIIRDSIKNEELERFPVLNDVLNERFSCDLYDYILHTDADMLEKQLLSYYVIVKSRILQDADALKQHINDQTAYTLLQKYEQLLKLITYFNLQEDSAFFESLAIKIVSIYLINIRERQVQENMAVTQQKMQLEQQQLFNRRQKEQQLLSNKAALEDELKKQRKIIIIMPCAMVLAFLLALIATGIIADMSMKNAEVNPSVLLLIWFVFLPAVITVGVIEIRKYFKNKNRIVKNLNEINRQLNGIQ